MVASYTYDAWGNHTVYDEFGVEDSCYGDVNPIRYRGYYFDKEIFMRGFKKQLPLIIFLGIMIAMVVINQIALLSDPVEIKYEWKIIVIEFIVIFVIMAIVLLVTSKIFSRCWAAFKANHYEYIISKRKYLLLFSRRSSQKHLLYFMIAISYIEIGDAAEFLRYINMVEHKSVINAKYYWLSVYSATIGDWQGYSVWKNKLYESDNNEAKKQYTRVLELIDRKNNDDCTFSEEEINIIESSSNIVKRLLLCD